MCSWSNQTPETIDFCNKQPPPPLLACVCPSAHLFLCFLHSTASLSPSLHSLAQWKKSIKHGLQLEAWPLHQGICSPTSSLYLSFPISHHFSLYYRDPRGSPFLLKGQWVLSGGDTLTLRCEDLKSSCKVTVPTRGRLFSHLIELWPVIP